jgi:hypothetical protein
MSAQPKVERRGRPRKIERKNPQAYTMLDYDINFDWDRAEVKEFDRLWAEGVSLEEIAKRFKRPHVEVLLLIVDRDLRRKIEPRPGGIYGRRRRG